MCHGKMLINYIDSLSLLNFSGQHPVIFHYHLSTTSPPTNYHHPDYKLQEKKVFFFGLIFQHLPPQCFRLSPILHYSCVMNKEHVGCIPHKVTEPRGAEFHSMLGMGLPQPEERRCSFCNTHRHSRC